MLADMQAIISRKFPWMNTSQLGQSYPWMMTWSQIYIYIHQWVKESESPGRKKHKGIILSMSSGNERPCYIVTSSLIGWAHNQNDPWIQPEDKFCGLAYWTCLGSMWVGGYALKIFEGTSTFLECVEWQAYYRNFKVMSMSEESMKRWSCSKKSVKLWVCVKNIWARSGGCSCLVTWFCYQLIAKPGNKTAAVPWPDPLYEALSMSHEIAKWNMWCSKYIHRNL